MADTGNMGNVERPAATDGEDSLLSFLRELPVLLVVALVLAFLLRTFVVQVFYIPSSSMEPTLQVQDRMVVEKVTYLFRGPQRGEVIVFAGDEPAQADDGLGFADAMTGVGRFLGVVPADARDFVKRVIGLPGDTVLVEDGTLYVNGTQVDEPYVVNQEPGSYGPYEVPDGSLFVMGDNRPDSSDSRRTLGYVRLENVVGRATVVIWPFDHVGGIEGNIGDDFAHRSPASALAVWPSREFDLIGLGRSCPVRP